MAEEDEDVKPKLNIVIDFEGQNCTIKVKASTPFKKIFEAAEKRFNKDSGTLKFHHDGVRLNENDTPADHNMEDGDQVDAFLAQQGGGIRHIP